MLSGTGRSRRPPSAAGLVVLIRPLQSSGPAASASRCIRGAIAVAGGLVVPRHSSVTSSRSTTLNNAAFAALLYACSAV